MVTRTLLQWFVNFPCYISWSIPHTGSMQLAMTEVEVFKDVARGEGNEFCASNLSYR